MEMEKFEEFFRQFYEKELMSAAAQGKISILVDFALLDKFDPTLADKLLNDPEELMEQARKAIKTVDLPEGSVKIEPRFFNLPESQNVRIRNLRSEHIGKMITVEGVVRRASEVKPQILHGVFECQDCGNKMEMKPVDKMLTPPFVCEKCGRKGRFNLVDRRLFDARLITIEEPFEITTGERSAQIHVFLKDDLTSPELQRKHDPGCRVKVVGLFKERKKMSQGRVKSELDVFLEANSIGTTEIEWDEVDISQEDIDEIKRFANDPEIYTKIIGSIAPSIFGLDQVKQAVALQMFSGVPQLLPDGVRIRGDIHILLLGDPSCLVADERIVMADGTIMKIGNMGARHLESINYNVHTGMGKNVGRATKFHLYRKQPIIEIITESGKSIRGTYNQPVLINQNMKQNWRRLDEVKIGDRVQVLPKIECKKKTYVKTNWKDFPYYHKSWKIKVPEVIDENLGAILGYVIADGWLQKRRLGFVINNEEMDILPKLEKAFKKCFDAPINSQKQRKTHPKITYYQIDRTHLAEMLSFLKEKRVPDFIFQSGNKVVASFLKWLYEGDGCVFSKGRGSLSISLKSNNIELLRDVQMLLLRFGIHSRILWEERTRTTKINGRKIKSKPSGNLMIRRSDSTLKFAKNIGFVSKKKIEKLKEAVKYAKDHVHRKSNKKNEKIVKINKLSPQDVFDIEVPEHKRFVANGIVVHNTAKSQILKLVSKVMPRGKYVSGRGASAAGLTATVVKDEEFTGGWVLEAGAMVLTNKSLLSIDEFDKIAKEDQIAMHEAMSIQTVSIAKASIIATLPAQVSVLAGANPKLSRFDRYKGIAQQIDIPDTLLSRFDLKFVLKDEPDRERDKKLSRHVIEARLSPEKIIPIIHPDMLRKYIAYARKYCKPTMTREAAEKLSDFYIDMRAKSTPDSVAITLRQNEALIRLAEAAAKVRLSNTVETKDAERAIALMDYSIRELGYDVETGKIDIDRIEEKTPATQRTKIRLILDIISKLEKQLGKKDVPIEEVIASAEDEGIKHEDTEELLHRLELESDIFKPKHGFVQRTS